MARLLATRQPLHSPTLHQKTCPGLRSLDQSPQTHRIWQRPEPSGLASPRPSPNKTYTPLRCRNPLPPKGDTRSHVLLLEEGWHLGYQLLPLLILRRCPRRIVPNPHPTTSQPHPSQVCSPHYRHPPLLQPSLSTPPPPPPPPPVTPPPP